MTAGSVHVLRPGLQTTVQDSGRWGFQALGVPVAGPMDPFAHRRANALLGNSRSAATFEVAITGPELEFDDERIVVVTGAQFDLTIDGRRVGVEEPAPVRAGSRLRFGDRTSGARAYVGISGGIETPPVLGSRSTHLPSRMGGWQGRALVRGDRVPLGGRGGRSRQVSAGGSRSPVEAAHNFGSLETGQYLNPTEAGHYAIRMLPGPDRNRFADEAFEALVSGAYTVGRDSDRMGFRLSGPPLRHSSGADIVSDATPFGTLQVPASGQPLLLMADRQTTGGYARIATVISADIGLAGQAAPGDRLRFELVTEAVALKALIAREQQLLALEPVE